MDTRENSINTLRDIKSMMEQSSRFVSLSGLSGVAAGLCALAGAGWAQWIIKYSGQGYGSTQWIDIDGVTLYPSLKTQLLVIAAITFIAAFLSAFLFTYIRSKKQQIPIWGFTSKRLMISIIIPLLAGGILVLRMLDLGIAGFIAPSCLIIYGIALFCASKYTLKEIRFLAYTEMVLGIINLWCIGYGLYFWALGFGVCHIVYGIYMWYKYERK